MDMMEWKWNNWLCALNYWKCNQKCLNQMCLFCVLYILTPLNYYSVLFFLGSPNLSPNPVSPAHNNLGNSWLLVCVYFGPFWTLKNVWISLQKPIYKTKYHLKTYDAKTFHRIYFTFLCHFSSYFCSNGFDYGCHNIRFSLHDYRGQNNSILKLG